MELIKSEELTHDADGYKYIIWFNRTNRTSRHFDSFTAALGAIRNKKFDFDTTGWKTDAEGMRVFEKIDAKLFPPRKTMKEKMAGVIKAEHKDIGDYSKMGADMKLQPYDYQKEITKFSLDSESALIVAPCGSGKTPCGIAIYLEAIKAGKITGPGMIVVKASLKTQWASEIKKFSDLRPGIIRTYKDCVGRIEASIKRWEKKLKTASGGGIADVKAKLEALKEEKEDTFLCQFENADLYVLNYETLRDTEVRRVLHKIKPQYIFADEVHYVKGDTTARAKALCEFADAKIKVGATATPVQRDPRDLYGIFKFVNPALFPKKGNFERVYIRWAGRGIVAGAQNEKQLNQKISPYMIIKTKEEVADQLPKLVVAQRYCDLEPAQLEITQRIMDELDDLHDREKSLQARLSDHEALHNEELLKIQEGILMRQTFAQELADSEQLLEASTSDAAKEYITGSNDNKLDILTDLVEEIIESGEKVCIFSRFAKMQQVITNRFKKEARTKNAFKFNIAYVNGAMSGEQRYEEVYDKFRDMDDYKVLLCSDAGAEGLNLSKCKYMIEVEPAISYAIQTQRHGRLERADSVHDTVFVYQLIANESWDEVGMKIVSKKERYDDTIIKGIQYEE